MDPSETPGPATVPVATPAAGEKPTKERMRISRACDYCKKKKIRCTGTQPCERCINEDEVCEYKAPYSRGRKKQKRKLLHLATPSSDASSMSPPATIELDISPETQQEQQSLPQPPNEGVESSQLHRADAVSVPAINAHAQPSGPLAPTSRSSPEPEESGRQGHFVGASSSVAFLLRLQRRLRRDAGGSSETSVFTLGDAVLPEFDELGFIPPSRQEAEGLLKTYFELASPTYRFLHRPTVERWLRQLYDNGSISGSHSRSKYAVILTTFAQAVRYTGVASNSPNANTGVEYFQAAERQLSRETESATLTSVQAMLGSCFYILTRSRLNHCWSLFGTTARHILALGLHRKKAKFEGGSGSATDLVEVECRKRLFWCAYNLDKYLSAIFGRPCAFHDDDIDQDMPALVEDEFLTADSIIVAGRANMNVMLGPLSHQRLGRILSSILRRLYGIKPLDLATQYETMSELGAEVEAWRQRLPAFLDPEKVDSRLLIPLFQRQSNLLSLAMGHARILIYRPCLFNDYQQINAAETKANIQKCVEAAMGIVEVIDRMVEANQFYAASWFAHYQAFCAVVVLYTYTIRSRAEDTSTWIRYFRAAERCQGQVVTVAGFDSLAYRFFVIMEEFRSEVVRLLQHCSVGPGDSKHHSNGSRGSSGGQVPQDMSTAFLPAESSSMQWSGNETQADQLGLFDLPNWEQLDSLALDLGGMIPDLSSMDPKLYLDAKEAWSRLSQFADLVGVGVVTREGFIKKSQEGGFDGVTAIYRTFYSVEITGPLDKDLIQALPSTVKFICHSGAGYDQVDVDACTHRGIRVSNVPVAVNDATADTTMFLILGALRGFNQGITTLRNGEWRGSQKPPLGHDPQGKTLGILGCGGVGRNLARKASIFGMKIIYHNRIKSADVTEAEFVDFETLLKKSDVLSICLPLNANTRYLISVAEFDKMKQGVIIVNTSRGPIINEDALVDALNTGKAWSCGLDVYENEPLVHPDLLAHPRAMLLPHLGTYTVETHLKMEERCIANVCSALEKGVMLDNVREQENAVFP